MNHLILLKKIIINDQEHHDFTEEDELELDRIRNTSMEDLLKESKEKS